MLHAVRGADVGWDEVFGKWEIIRLGSGGGQDRGAGRPQLLDDGLADSLGSAG